MSLKFNIDSITPVQEEGGEVKNQNKTITENGVYIPDTGYTGFGRVTVDVETTEPTLITKTITENGTYSASIDNVDGYSSVSVNVETTEPTITTLSIEPSTTDRTIIAPVGTDGYNTITVKGVTSSIDADIVAGNIKSGVNILGVDGTVTELVSETTTITSNGTYIPQTGNGFTSVSVNVAGTTPSGTYTITSNGTYDVTDYASANVNVSGGGGSQVVRGSWVVPQAVLDLEDAFDTWQTTHTATQKYLYGVLVPKGIGMVKLRNTKADTVTAIDGATITKDGSTASVTFVNQDADNWVVFEAPLLIGDYVVIIPYNSYLSDDVLINGGIKYLIIKDNVSSSTTFTQSPFVYTSGYGLSNLIAIKSINISLGNKFTGDEMRGAGRAYMPPASYWDSDVPDSSVINNFNNYAHLLPNLPYGLDFSSSTTDLTLGTNDCGNNHIKEAYIKLPNANFTIKNYSCIFFTKDNWQYIADNAPTVSGKTLTMGDINVAICGGSAGTIISTLVNKGWTVN